MNVYTKKDLDKIETCLRFQRKRDNENIGVVYALKDEDGVVVYVGQSSDYRRAFLRITEHLRNSNHPSPFVGALNKKFSSWAMVAVSRSDLDYIETVMIARFNPKYNIYGKQNRTEKTVDQLTDEAIQSVPEDFILDEVIAAVKSVAPGYATGTITAAFHRSKMSGLCRVKVLKQGPMQRSLYTRA